jgi:hypothetical protein
MKHISMGMELTTQDILRYVSPSPRGTAESAFQHRFSVNVCRGLMRELLFGPLVLELLPALPDERISAFNGERVFGDMTQDVLSP